MSGLDDLVADAMNRKLIEPPPSPAVSSESVPVEAPDIDTSRSPDVSLAFAVNGVKCIVTIHVESGANVTTPSTPTKKAPSGGVKVKGIRGAKTEEVEAPEPSEAGFDKTKPISDDNLPEGWVSHPVVGATIPDPEPEKGTWWTCPEHDKVEDRLSNITGRTFSVCPECGRLAPK